MDLAAFASLGSIIACMIPAFGRRLQGATIKDSRRWLSGAPFGFAQQQAQIVDECREAACGQPALSLLIDNVPGGVSHWASCARARLRVRSSASRSTLRAGCRCVARHLRATIASTERQRPIRRRSRQSGKEFVKGSSFILPLSRHRITNRL